MIDHATVPQDNEPADDQPVNPAIGEAKKYRKRAQAAEQSLSELQSDLEAKATQITQLEQTVTGLQRSQRVNQLLIEADAIDLESARLLTELAVSQMDEPDVAEAVEELRRTKPFLFRARVRTSGAHAARTDDAAPIRTAAEAAAGQACATGHRSDLLRYLRLKRRVK